MSAHGSVDVPAALMVENKGAVQMTSGFTFTEEITESLSTSADLVSISFNATSKFQQVQIIETVPFGKTLVLDGKTQSAQVDEYVYHECLVQPAMLAVGWALGTAYDNEKLKRAYIGGGGELATARELLKHSSIEEVVMVDIDEVAVDICREQLPEWGDGAADDPRLKLFYTDAYAWLDRDDEATGTFDIIVMDIADPIEAGPGIALYTSEFYELAKRKLRPGGVLVTQSGPGGLITHTECLTAIHNTLRASFEHVLPFIAEIPSFGCPWAWNLAFDATGTDGSALSPAEAKNAGVAFREQQSEVVDARLAKCLPADALKFYDGGAHRGIFGIGKPIRQALARDDRIISRDNPVFMH